jgi:hypothetical protein
MVSDLARAHWRCDRLSEWIESAPLEDVCDEALVVCSKPLEARSDAVVAARG